MKKHVIVDFDNTMGVEGCDVDDGLALLYLLGFDDVCIDGICTTYGNSTLEIVHENTAAMLARMGLDVPLYRGGANPDDLQNDASRFMAAAAEAAAQKGEPLYVIATGSLTNLRGAHVLDPGFYANLSGVYVMGGYTESLPYHGAFIDELNLSCDPDAALDVLAGSLGGSVSESCSAGASVQVGDEAAPSAPDGRDEAALPALGGCQGDNDRSGCPITVATGQACLPATFDRKQFVGEFGQESWVIQACDSWFKNMEEHFDWPHAVCWDVVAAASLVQPELFAFDEMEVTLYRRYLSVGLLERAPEGAPKSTIRIPVIADVPKFVAEVFAAWRRGLAAIGLE